jgi:hypothetical protein
VSDRRFRAASLWSCRLPPAGVAGRGRGVWRFADRCGSLSLFTGLVVALSWVTQALLGAARWCSTQLRGSPSGVVAKSDRAEKSRQLDLALLAAKWFVTKEEDGILVTNGNCRRGFGTNSLRFLNFAEKLQAGRDQWWGIVFRCRRITEQRTRRGVGQRSARDKWIRSPE